MADGRIPLLKAVAEQRIDRADESFGAAYLLDGVDVQRWALNQLRKMAWIDMPLSGPPRITPDGAKWLKEHSP